MMTKGVVVYKEWLFERNCGTYPLIYRTSYVDLYSPSICRSSNRSTCHISDRSVHSSRVLSHARFSQYAPRERLLNLILIWSNVLGEFSHAEMRASRPIRTDKTLETAVRLETSSLVADLETKQIGPPRVVRACQSLSPWHDGFLERCFAVVFEVLLC
jgi:hypothetical protein